MLLPILLYLFTALTSDPAAAHPAWGIGVLLPLGEQAPSEGELLFPYSSISFARTPLGPAVGDVWRDDMTLKYEGRETGSRYVTDSSIQQVAYETYAVQVYAQANGRVAIRGAAGDGFLWLDESDLDQEHLAFVSWIDFLSKENHSYYPIPERGLNLRKEADPKSALLTTMKGDNFSISPNGGRQGMWLSVTVDKYNIHPCEGGEVQQTWVGWVKAIDDRGYPNLWFYPRGC